MLDITSGWFNQLEPNEEARQRLEIEARQNAVDNSIRILSSYPEFAGVINELRRISNELATKNSI